MIITRFAPSPTGELHIGGARTALFAYLFAKQKGGKFLLRIEDTDRERLVEGSIERIIEMLNWLGMAPDNGKNILVQSKRLDIYKKYAEQLVENGKAYICVCDKEKLAKEKQEQIKQGQPPKYSGHCRNLNIKFEDAKSGHFVIRMKMPESGKITVKDLIRGNVDFDLSLFDDQVLMKSDGYPTYHLASVIDDHEMKISHIIRAEEWLPSAPKHIILYQMFDWDIPEFAHLPMILSPEKGKLSKRHGAMGVLEYKNGGYLPEAMVNFMALLGWHPKDDREIFNLKELIKEFDLSRVQKSGAIFNIEKLNWLNAHYIKNSDNKKLRKTLKEFFGDRLNLDKISDELVELSKQRMVKLSEFIEINAFFFNLPDYSGDLLVWKNMPREKIIGNLENILKILEKIKISGFNKHNLEKELMPLADKQGRGETLWPLRVALSGKDKSPTPFELLAILGKEESIKRIKIAANKLK